MSDKIFLHIEGCEPVEIKPLLFDEHSVNSNEDKIPLQFLIAGKPLLNSDGSSFWITNEQAKEIYGRDEHLFVFVGKYSKE